jgi:glycerol dehydrogenase-like iron-containing ADH family enzyme
MKSVQERDSRWIQRPEAESGDHAFWLALEEKHNTSYIHGEMVAFSAIIIAWQCNEQPEILTNRLDRCKVRRRPREIGISREELRTGLEFAPIYMERKDTNTILRHQPITGSQFDRLWEFLETS